MIVIYSKHSIERMQQRGISKDKVELTVTKPDRIKNKEKEKVAIKKIDGSVLIVFLKKRME